MSRSSRIRSAHSPPVRRATTAGSRDSTQRWSRAPGAERISRACTSPARSWSRRDSSRASLPARSTRCTRRSPPQRSRACSSGGGTVRSCRSSGWRATITISPRPAPRHGSTADERLHTGACRRVRPPRRSCRCRKRRSRRRSWKDWHCSKRHCLRGRRDDDAGVAAASLPVGCDRARCVCRERWPNCSRRTGVLCFDPTSDAVKQAQVPFFAPRSRARANSTRLSPRSPTPAPASPPVTGATLVFVATAAGRDRLMIDGDELTSRADQANDSPRARFFACYDDGARAVLRQRAAAPDGRERAAPHGRLCRRPRRVPLSRRIRRAHCIHSSTCRYRYPFLAGRARPWCAGPNDCSVDFGSPQKLSSTTTVQVARALLERDFPGDARQAIDALRKQIARSAGVVAAAGKRIDPVLDRALKGRARSHRPDHRRHRAGSPASPSQARQHRVCTIRATACGVAPGGRTAGTRGDGGDLSRSLGHWLARRDRSRSHRLGRDPHGPGA